MKRVIVTGGSGFIGSNLVKYLLKKKYFVINIDNLSYSANPYNTKNLKKNKNYIFFKIDLNNKTKIIKILKKYKPIGIFNLAAETHVDRSIDSPQKFIESNILGTFNLLEAIRKYKKGIKLLHVSTDEVYGDIIKGRSDEKFSYNPSSPYSSTKASADHLVKSYIRTYKIPALISNCCNNYGPNQFPEKLIPKLIFNILNNKPLPIYGKGKNSREWMHVYDHCEALLLIFLKGKIGENYNIGSGINLRNIDIAKKLLMIVKKKSLNINKKVKIRFVKDRPGHDFRYALNNKKILKDLGWKSKISLSVGLSNTFDWYLNNKLFFKSVLKKHYVNRMGLKL
ncbi:dTDP-glucose 4,6-dehydratase [Pelagibacteraceae bacterium]|jgi:dTDP-glucose 4,6-dehydratase|nr:dTDP-glucose 4,6-dehydratase [Pelagibacteraceae bacterium]